MKHIPLAALALAALLAGCAGGASLLPREEAPTAAAVPAELLDPAVTPQTIDATICTYDYAKRVRAPQSRLDAIHRKLVYDNGLTEGTLYSLEQRVPTEIGGHPSEMRNFTLQLWDSDANAKRRQRLALTLQRLVCAHRITLRDAQTAYVADWREAYRRYVED